MNEQYTALSNWDLIDRLKGIKGFKGVFSRDEDIGGPALSESGVMNLAALDEPGTHWVAWVCRPKFTVYFDSFGVPPPDTMKKYLSRHPGTHWRTDSEIQSLESVMCGYYCEDFIKSCWNARNILAVTKWLNEYKPFPDANEKTLISNLKKMDV